jgi:hypothetical protein
MNKTYRTLIIVALIGIFAFSADLYAGNKDRSGQSGAQHLLIDPWAKSNGWGTAGVAETMGIESIYSNVAGIARLRGTEFGFSRTQYLTGSNAGIGINSFGIIQALSRKDKDTGAKKNLGTLGVSVFTMGFGDIPVTTSDQPEGTNAMFSPTLTYIGIHYAKSFNRYIHGGISGKIVNERIADMGSTGFAIDAGVQYISGAYENFKIGVTLKNLGLPMRYSGDGLSIRGAVENTGHSLTLEQRSAEAEMPALLTLGVSYDFLFWGKEYKNMSKKDRVDEGLTRDQAEHRLTLAGSFTANSYSSDIFALGMEYSLMQIFQVRVGYAVEGSQLKRDVVDGKKVKGEATTWYAGPSAGVSVGIPLVKKNKGNQKIYLDYAYRFTNKWSGNHYIGVKVAL